MMEIWDVYNRDRILTGKTMVRGSRFEKDAYHLVVHVCFFNSDDHMLIQQRQPFKTGWSNMWDLTVGGSALAGDTSKEAAEREVFEEIGYRINLEHVRPSLTINFEYGFDDFYLIVEDLDINRLVLQPEEVQKVRWATKGEILSLIDKKEFIPYHKSLIDVLFDMRKNMGTHVRQAK
ncbi:MAG TPA: NUDIX hydrolase [Bacillus sp. (in: Bacteria)]|nr:NUDIX hydrolase [Bacillus sp. (in: firmicutes)]